MLKAHALFSEKGPPQSCTQYNLLFFQAPSEQVQLSDFPTSRDKKQEIMRWAGQLGSQGVGSIEDNQEGKIPATI